MAGSAVMAGILLWHFDPGGGACTAQEKRMIEEGRSQATTVNLVE